MTKKVLDDLWNKVDEIETVIHQAQDKLDRARDLGQELRGYIESIQELNKK